MMIVSEEKERQILLTDMQAFLAAAAKAETFIKDSSADRDLNRVYKEFMRLPLEEGREDLVRRRLEQCKSCWISSAEEG